MQRLRYYLSISVSTVVIGILVSGCSGPIMLVPPMVVEDDLPRVDDAEVAFDVEGMPNGGESLLTEEMALLARLRTVHQSWEGTPYRFGGTGRDGIDCSAFVQRVFRETFELRLTRATATQVHEGREVARSELQTGDLVFFQTGRRQRHVGIYLRNGRFLHSSSRKGVTIDRLDGFYDRTFWTARRVITPRVLATLLESTTPPAVKVASDRPPVARPETPTETRRPEARRPAPEAGTAQPSNGDPGRRTGW